MTETTQTKRILNGVPSQKSDTHWTMQDAREAGLLPAEGTPIPDTVDLREDWWNVGFQENTGTCVAWAVTDGVLRWKFVKSGQIKPTDWLAVRYIYMASKEISDLIIENKPTTFFDTTGTYPEYALMIARKYGVVLDNILPFNSAELYMGEVNDFYALASKLKIKSYFNLFEGVTDKVLACKQWLAAGNGPIALLMDCTSDFQEWMPPQAPNFITFTAPPTPPSGGHGVCIVGYTKDYLIIRNSWGNLWGDNGHAYFSDAYFNGVAWEAWGVAL